MDKYIACTTEKQWEDVLKKFEEDGYKWCAGNSVMSGLEYFNSYKENSVLHVHTDSKKLGYSFKAFYRGKTFISAHDFLKGEKTKPIVISRKGRVVTAEDKNTGEKGVATCSPSDTFDFKIGAKIALARLLGEEVPKSPLNDDEIRENDIVEVVEPLQCYDIYTAWIIKNIASVDLASKFVYHHIPRTDTQYRVIKIASHSGDSKFKLAYIQDQTRDDCFIMNLSALKKVKK